MQRRIGAGALRVFRDGRVVRIDRLELARYVAARTAKPAATVALPMRRRASMPDIAGHRVERLW